MVSVPAAGGPAAMDLETGTGQREDGPDPRKRGECEGGPAHPGEPGDPGDPGDPDAPGGERPRTAAAADGRPRARDPWPETAWEDSWDDGLIARRAPHAPHAEDPAGAVTAGAEPVRTPAGQAGRAGIPLPGTGEPDAAGAGAGAGGFGTDRTGGRGPALAPAPRTPGVRSMPGRALDAPGASALRARLDALRQLVVLSRTRLDGRTLAEASRVLDEATDRSRMPSAYAVVAVAGATGSGKSSLFNALAGAQLSEAGTRRPTTAVPVACVWQGPEETESPDGLLDRLGVAPRARRRVQVRDSGLQGLVLLDLPDHDSAAKGRREQVDRLLELVDAVIWVVDPEKYADALLHERYLRPFAGYAEVMYVVLNQVDRLPGEAVDHVLHDLRRLLDEDGMPLSEHGEPGATVLALSTVTGQGIDELRGALTALVAERAAPARRLAADVDGAVTRLQPAFVCPGTVPPAGLTARAREEFEERLAAAVGAAAAGQAAERSSLRQAERSCGTPWVRLLRWYGARRAARHGAGPGPRPAAETAEVLSAVPEAAEAPGLPPAGAAGAGAGLRVARPVLEQAVRVLAVEATAGLPEPWAKTVREAARRGAEGLPDALEAAVRELPPDGPLSGEPLPDGPLSNEPGPDGPQPGESPAAEPQPAAGAGGAAGAARMPRPGWWKAVACGQVLLVALQLLGAGWLTAVLCELPLPGFPAALLPPLLLLAGGTAGGPLLAWCGRLAARGPARTHGQEEERRLRRLAAGCGRTRVLEPVAAELLRYREVREQYAIAAGGLVHF